MKTMELTNKLTLEKTWHTKLQRDFQSTRATDAVMCATMKRALKTFGYLADPHTSVMLAAFEKLGYDVAGEAFPMAVFATASPCKFRESVEAAVREKGWKEYAKSDAFPTKAVELLCMKEIPPTVYPWREGASLSEMQR